MHSLRRLIPIIALITLLMAALAPAGGRHALAATLTVNTTSDSSSCSGGTITLRCAIATANSDCSAAGSACDTITFDIAGCATLCTIAVSASQPGLTLTSPYITIDGTNTATSGKPIEIDGSATTGGESGISIIIFGTANETIEHLSIVNFKSTASNTTGAGIYLSPAAAGNIILDNDLGVPPDGTTSGDGNDIGINSYGEGSAITGNVVSGNATDGIFMVDDSGTVQGNKIGTTADGSGKLANGGNGLEISGGSGNCIGGTLSGFTCVPGTGNVISGNGGNGILINGNSANAIMGNMIGVNAAGTAAIPNTDDGIQATSAAQGTLITSGNVIGGNTGNGVAITGAGTTGDGGDTIQGNLIGTNKNGARLGNGQNGILFQSTLATETVGGAGTGQSNAIAFNSGSGVQVGSTASDAISAAITHNSIYDNVQTTPATTGTAGEIYLDGQNPATCSSSTSSTTTPNYHLPCPALSGPTSGVVTALTCPGCTVDFYTYTTGPNDGTPPHGGSVTWVGSATAGGRTACDPATSGSACSNAQTVRFTLPPGVNGVTSTATIKSASSPSVTVTSAFSNDAGSSVSPPTDARVARVLARRHGAAVVFHWRMAIQQGVIGFNVFAGKHRLNRQLIRAHAGTKYHFKARWTGARRFYLHIVLDNGTHLTVPAR